MLRLCALLFTLTPSLAFAGEYGTNGTSCAHATLAAAIAAAGPGGTVYVKSGALTAAVATVVPHDITLKGSNATCSSAAAGQSDLAVSGDRALIIGYDVAVQLYRITLTGEAATDGGVIYMHTGSTLGMVDSALRDGHADGRGGCLYGEGTNEVLLWGGSEIRDCGAVGQGGGGYLEAGTLYVMSGSSILDNQSDHRGGGVMLHGGEAYVMGDVAGNVAFTDGGGLAASNGAIVSVTGVVSGNLAFEDGGGIAAYDSDVSVTGTLEQNEAESYGGGAYLDASVVTLDGAQLLENEAGVYGGGLYLDGGSAGSGQGRWYLNTASQGGGAYVRWEASLDLVNSTFDANLAEHSGGAVFVLGGQFTMDADFETCTPTCGAPCSAMRQNVARAIAGGYGGGYAGAVGVLLDGSATIDHTLFYGNTAELYGSAIWVSAADVALKNSLVQGNVNFLGGESAVHADDGGLDVRSTTFFENDVPVVYENGATGAFHRNLESDNDNDPQFGATITGNCNLTEAVATNLVGVNEVGTTVLDSCGVPTASLTDVVDQCGAGPTDDYYGSLRTDGLWDRGAVEL